ncbi:hypothetical protein QAD02_005691 [Eretmocerus hayati]|uniref:Uncharacterized protein n=1 Tax=Eretmocerus hayati TaxID=131215 RepID=A0ACC2NTL7_9HYME|nr:hypothetical protein QAD02_005691 [Eretmocerus hayati]
MQNNEHTERERASKRCAALDNSADSAGLRRLVAVSIGFGAAGPHRSACTDLLSLSLFVPHAYPSQIPTPTANMCTFVVVSLLRRLHHQSFATSPLSYSSKCSKPPALLVCNSAPATAPPTDRELDTRNRDPTGGARNSADGGAPSLAPRPPPPSPDIHIELVLVMLSETSKCKSLRPDCCAIFIVVFNVLDRDLR